tara:strand:+ start:646 stop:1365 length:720 start_codon:yes stop_codon:yes gene_type:complete
MFAYLGGKSRIYKKLINFMEAERRKDMTWVEPFMGSGKVLFNVKGPRIGNDINHELIALFKAIQDGYEPPISISEEEYNYIKKNQSLFNDPLKGFVSIACAFGGQRWGSYARNKKGDNYALRSSNQLLKHKHKYKGVDLYSCNYKDLSIPSSSLIYCDPPYINTAGYGFEFNHEEFYDWCREKVKEGHLVFISEYQAPKDFECVWSKKVLVSVAQSKINYKEEKLFRVHKKPKFKLITY